MSEIVIALTIFAALFVAMIEVVERCKHLHAVAEQEARRYYQVDS